jgi:hypothetical protein
MKNLLLSCFLGGNLLLSCPVSCPAQSQSFRLAPRLNGQRFVEAAGGLAVIPNQDRLTLKSSGWHGSLSTGRYGKNLNAWKWTIGYVRKPIRSTITDSLATTTIPKLGKTEQFTVGYGRELLFFRSAFRTFLVRGQLQPFVGYESVSHISQPVLADSTVSARSGLLAGTDFGLEVELQPVVLGIRQRWTPTSDVGRWGTLLYVGVRLGWQ